jgi:methylenetetrahydrofolate reductase (NADPH)
MAEPKDATALSSAQDSGTFAITVEVVPPAGPDAEPLLAALESVRDLPFDGYSVATNPVAKPRMSALALSALLQQRTGKPATLHCTTRDHNRLSIQGLLWGARALGITTVLVATGDYVALATGRHTTSVRDVDVFSLVHMAREAGLHTGVVLDPRPESNGLHHQVRRLEQKVQAGAQFVVTQPVYGQASAQALYEATRHIGIPVILGILPLRTARHARFLHHKVAGVAIPEAVQRRMERATDPVAEGTAGAQEVLSIARQWFAGACLMPPFDHYEVLSDILQSSELEGKREALET